MFENTIDIIFSCFVVLLVVAGLVWIVKQRVERYQLMQSRHIEITRVSVLYCMNKMKY